MTVGLAVAACAPSLPVPRAGTPDERYREYVAVPYPPPCAQIEVIPPSPERGAVWVDGEWAWQAKRWAWQPGGWVIAPDKDAFFARWAVVVRPDDGVLRFAPGSWHAKDGARLPMPRVLLTAGAP